MTIINTFIPFNIFFKFIFLISTYPTSALQFIRFEFRFESSPKLSKLSNIFNRINILNLCLSVFKSKSFQSEKSRDFYCFSSYKIQIFKPLDFLIAKFVFKYISNNFSHELYLYSKKCVSQTSIFGFLQFYAVSKPSGCFKLKI